MNDKRKTTREPKKLYEDKIISIGKVTKVTQGGRNFRFSATVAVGDRKGKVGIGTGKSKEIPVAVSKAIKEAKITGSRKLTDADFLRQMRIWFPAFFLMKEDEDEEKMIRRYASSLSVERQKWIESSEKQEIAISDMIAHSQKRDRDRLKAIRYHGIAEGLRAQLEEMKKKGY